MAMFLGSGGAAGSSRSHAVAGVVTAWVRHFSRKCNRDLRKIDPKVPREEAKAISEGLSQILQEHGPLTVSDTWNHAKEVGISGLNSKSHLKIILKWMRGRNMLNLSCTQEGKHKRFLHSIPPPEVVLRRPVRTSTESSPQLAAS